MHVIYCNMNMFTLNSTVYDINEDEHGTSLFSGNFEEVSDFIAAEYKTGKYGKVILAGPYAEALEDRVRAYSALNYDMNDIKIEIME